MGNFEKGRLSRWSPTPLGPLLEPRWATVGGALLVLGIDRSANKLAGLPRWKRHARGFHGRLGVEAIDADAAIVRHSECFHDLFTIPVLGFFQTADLTERLEFLGGLD